MQQTCSNCRYPIQPGNAVCTNCGTPVSAGGGGYDPTVRAGASPNSGYGQPPYGAPASPNPYGAPPAQDPYSAQYSGPPPASPYGAPNSGPQFGAPPQGGFGAPQQGGFGAPQQGGFGGPPPGGGFGGPAPFGAPTAFPGQMPPKQKSNKTLYTILGVIGGLVVVAIIGCIVISSLAKKAVTTGLATINQTETAVAQQTNNAEATATAAAGQLTGNPVTGPHITKIQMGTGFDQNTGAVIGETYNFTKGSEAWVVYTVDSPDANGQVTLKLFNGGSQTATAGPDGVDQGTNIYGNQLTNLQTGLHMIELDYNGAPEATITFNVS